MKNLFILNLGYESDYEGDVEVLGSDDEQYKPGLSASSEGKIFSTCSNWLTMLPKILTHNMFVIHF